MSEDKESIGSKSEEEQWSDFMELSRSLFEGPKRSVWSKIGGWSRVLFRRVTHQWDFEATLIVKGKKAPSCINGVAVMLKDFQQRSTPSSTIIIASSGRIGGLAELALIEGVVAIVTATGGTTSHFAIRAAEAIQVERGQEVAFITGAKDIDKVLKTGDRLQISIIEGARRSFIRKLP